MATNCTDNNVHYTGQELINEDKEYAAAHLNETDEIRDNAIVEIRCWTEESDDLLKRIDDFLILRFLRVCKFNLEKTMARIRNYYKHRSDLPEWYKNTDPFRSELQELHEMGIVLPLRKPDNQGRLIIIVRGNLYKPRKHKMPDLAKICILALETTMKYYPSISIHGYSIFIDTNSLTAKKFKNRFHVHSHKHCLEDIPADILPVEYDGTDGTLEELKVHWKKLNEKNRDWIKKITEDQ